MGNGFGFAEKNAVCTETRYSYSYNAMKRACKKFEVHLGSHSSKCHGIHRHVQQQQEDSDVNCSTKSSVHHRGVEADAHRKRP